MRQWLHALPQPIAVSLRSAPTRRTLWVNLKEFIVSCKAIAIRTAALYKCQMRMIWLLMRSSEPTVRFHLLACMRLRSSPEPFPYVLVECDHVTRQAHIFNRIAVCGAGMCVREDGLELALRLLTTCCQHAVHVQVHPSDCHRTCQTKQSRMTCFTCASRATVSAMDCYCCCYCYCYHCIS
jgi:hypothetical protein